MRAVLDPTTDTQLIELTKLSQLYEFPDFLKQADIEETMSPSDIPLNSYALPQASMYPCHTKAGTALSIIYYFDKRGEFQAKTQLMIEDRLAKAAEYFGLSDFIEAVEKKADEANKPTTLPDSAYVYVEVVDGVKVGYEAMVDAVTTKRAADWLLSQQDVIPYAVRKGMAERILFKVAEFNVGLKEQALESLEKNAGRGYPDTAKLASCLQRRAKLAQDEESRSHLRQVAESILSVSKEASASLDWGFLVNALEAFDERHNLRTKYAHLVERPVDVIFEVNSVKLARDCGQQVQLSNGTMYSEDSFTKLSKDALAGVFGEDFASAACNDGHQVDPGFFKTASAYLTQQQSLLLETLLKQAGEMPVVERGHILCQTKLTNAAKLYSPGSH